MTISSILFFLSFLPLNDFYNDFFGTLFFLTLFAQYFFILFFFLILLHLFIFRFIFWVTFFIFITILFWKRLRMVFIFIIKKRSNKCLYFAKGRLSSKSTLSFVYLYISDLIFSVLIRYLVLYHIFHLLIKLFYLRN